MISRALVPHYVSARLINMEPDAKPVVYHPTSVESEDEIIGKDGNINTSGGRYNPIADSRWVSPVHCVPKKGGITVIPNDKNELIPRNCYRL